MFDFVREEGIPLYLVPSAGIGAELLNAEDHAARRTVLGRRFEALLADCERVIDTCSDPNWADQVPFLRDGIASARAGFTAPAQALFASVLDTLVLSYFPDTTSRLAVLSHKSGEPPETITDETLSAEYVWLPIWNAYKPFWTQKGDLIPTDFARHASAHAVSKRQYSKRNCVQACMLATRLIGYLQGEKPLDAN